MPKEYIKPNRSSNPRPKKWPQPFSKPTLLHAARVMGPTLVALAFAGVAHAQGTMDFSGAQTLMGTFNSRFAYVSVSRASHDAQIYTNNAASLAKNLSHDVSKASAVSLSDTHTISPKIGPSPASNPGNGIALGLSL